MIEDKAKIKKYLGSNTDLIVGFIIIAVGVIMALCFSAAEVAFMTIASYFMDIIGIFFTLSFIKEKIKLNKWFKKIELTGQLPNLVQDFNDARSFFDNNLRMGDSYIFGKNSGKAYLYKDIERVWQHIHKTNGSEDGRALYIKTKDSKDSILCNLPTNGSGDFELNTVVRLIMLHNPEVKIGYR